MYDKSTRVVYKDIKPEDNNSALENISIYYDLKYHKNDLPKFKYLRWDQAHNRLQCGMCLETNASFIKIELYQVIDYYEWLKETEHIIAAKQCGLF